MKKALSFKRLFKEGRYYRSRDFSLRALENDLDASRLGISIQAKIFPRAVQRNKIKRLIREVFRKNKYRLNNDYDIIIRPKSIEITKLEYIKIEERILGLFNIAKILRQE